MQSTSLGRVLEGRYRLEASLGSGASAEVYRALDFELGRLVAVKLLRRGLAEDPSFLPRFQAEARAVAALNHPNIVQIHDWGKDDGQPFLVLEYLAGGSLRALLESGKPLGPSEIAQIGSQTARALEFAHGRGIVHRDIKPANLLFDEEGNIHVADFGLARAMVATDWTEPLGVVFGTSRYASPEQARGENVTNKSDVFSLAVVCYEALTGEPPFVADTPIATLMARTIVSLPMSPKLGRLAPALRDATMLDPNRRLDAAMFATALEGLALELPPSNLSIAAVLEKQVLPTTQSVSDDPHNTTILGIDRQGDTEAIVIVDSAVATASLKSNKDRRSLRSRVVGLRKRVVVGMAILILLAGLAVGGVAAYVHYSVYGYSTPAVKGLPMSSARSLISHSGLRISHISHAFSSSIPSGDVLSQSIKPGTHVRQRTELALVISSGHAPVQVPHLAGLAASRASALARADGLHMNIHDSYSETAPPGTVIAASPSSGIARYGSSVDAAISLGPQPRTIPNMSGIPYAQARQELVGLRLKPARIRTYSNDVAVGEVISSQPAFGATGIPVGSKVTLSVSRGPLLVAVPNVSGDPIPTAVAALNAIGLNVTEEIGPPFATTVTTTDPTAGSMVPPGSNVTIYAS